MKQNKVGFFDSVKTRLIAIMLAVVIVPLAVAIIVSYVTSTNKAMKDAQNSLEWQAWYVQSLFVNSVDTNMRMIQSIAGNPTIINYVKGNDIPYDAVQATLQA